MVKAATYPPIGDYALISDCHSGALVSRDGSIDWCVFHRFEARPVFARILDWAKAGFFRIAPLDDDYESTRRYLPGTNVLETTFCTPGGIGSLRTASHNSLSWAGVRDCNFSSSSFASASGEAVALIPLKW